MLTKPARFVLEIIELFRVLMNSFEQSSTTQRHKNINKRQTRENKVLRKCDKKIGKLNHTKFHKQQQMKIAFFSLRIYEAGWQQLNHGVSREKICSHLRSN